MSNSIEDKVFLEEVDRLVEEGNFMKLNQIGGELEEEVKRKPNFSTLDKLERVRSSVDYLLKTK